MSDFQQPDRSYRPAVRGLVFGVLAVCIRAATVGFLFCTATGPEASGALPILNLLGTLVALVGVAYSAIASHQKQWGVVLVLAWILSVLGVLLEIEPFVYVMF